MVSRDPPEQRQARATASMRRSVERGRLAFSLFTSNQGASRRPDLRGLSKNDATNQVGTNILPSAPACDMAGCPRRVSREADDIDPRGDLAPTKAEQPQTILHNIKAREETSSLHRLHTTADDEVERIHPSR